MCTVPVLLLVVWRVGAAAQDSSWPRQYGVAGRPTVARNPTTNLTFLPATQWPTAIVASVGV